MLSLSFPEIAYCCAVIVAAYAVPGSTASTPLLALVVPLKILVPVWTLLGAASSVAIVAKSGPTQTFRDNRIYPILGTNPTGVPSPSCSNANDGTPLRPASARLGNEAGGLHFIRSNAPAC